MRGHGGYGVAVARELVELSVWVQLPVATQKQQKNAKQFCVCFWSGYWELKGAGRKAGHICPLAEPGS